jgi:hypothetical protein
LVDIDLGLHGGTSSVPAKIPEDFRSLPSIVVSNLSKGRDRRGYPS